MKVKVKSTPLGDVFSCGCCAAAGPLGVSAATSNLAPASIFTILFDYLFYFIYFFLVISERCSPGRVSERAEPAGFQGGWVPTAPSSDWNRSPWDTLPSSLLPAEQQPPEEKSEQNKTLKEASSVSRFQPHFAEQREDPTD